MKKDDLADYIAVFMSIAVTLFIFDGPIQGQTFWIAVPLSAVLFLAFKALTLFVIFIFWPPVK